MPLYKSDKRSFCWSAFYISCSFCPFFSIAGTSETLGLCEGGIHFLTIKKQIPVKYQNKNRNYIYIDKSAR